jgi:hypothetical protein
LSWRTIAFKHAEEFHYYLEVDADKTRASFRAKTLIRISGLNPDKNLLSEPSLYCTKSYVMIEIHPIHFLDSSDVYRAPQKLMPPRLEVRSIIIDDNNR